MDGFTIFGLEIKFYGIIMASAMVLAYFIARRLAQKRGMNPDDILTLALIVLPLSILGARTYYVIFSGEHYTFLEFIGYVDGRFMLRGLAIYGGVIGGMIGVLIFCAIKKSFKILPVLLDIITPVLILGQALGRWGNFFNQEAYGYEVTNPHWQWFPFAVYIEDVGAWHMATFFYESMWNFIVFAVLMRTFYKYESPGTTASLYLILYGIGRFFIEGLRTDSLYLWHSPIRVSQALSLLIVIGGAVWLTLIILANKRNKYEKDV